MKVKSVNLLAKHILFHSPSFPNLTPSVLPLLTMIGLVQPVLGLWNLTNKGTFLILINSYSNINPAYQSTQSFTETATTNPNGLCMTNPTEMSRLLQDNYEWLCGHRTGIAAWSDGRFSADTCRLGYQLNGASLVA